MGFSSYVKRAASAVTSGGSSELKNAPGGTGKALAATAALGTTGAMALYGAKKVGGALKSDGTRTPYTSEKRTTQPFDYTQIAKQLKQMEAVKGRAINPDIMKSLVAGSIEGQVGPAMEREERAMTREAAERMHKERMDIEAGAAEAKGKAGVGALIGGVAGLISGVPGGAQVGAGAGGMLGGVSIICSELYRQKLISRKVYIGATKYREKHIDDEAYEGYLMWAGGVVSAMQKSKAITKIAAFFWIPLTEDMASRINNTENNMFGRIVTKVAIPFSRCVYKMRGDSTCLITQL